MYLITKDEEHNIGRVLESVRWMDEIVVLDSGSTDRTADIARSLGARVVVSDFRGFVEQKNAAMKLCTGEWVFNIDADEEVTPELRRSIEDVVYNANDSGADVFSVARRTWYMNRWIRHCGWYPEYRTRLSRKGCAEWRGEILHESLEGDTPPVALTGDLLHRPYEDMGEHITTIRRYTELWAARESGKGRRASITDMAFRPVFRFVKMYVIRAGFLDGIPGFVASVMGAWYVFMKYTRLYEVSGKSE